MKRSREVKDGNTPEEHETTTENLLPGPLYYAVKLQLMHVAMSIMNEVNCDENERNSLRESILIVACGKGPIDLVNVLLEKGADITVATRDG